MLSRVSAAYSSETAEYLLRVLNKLEPEQEIIILPSAAQSATRQTSKRLSRIVMTCLDEPYFLSPKGKWCIDLQIRQDTGDTTPGNYWPVTETFLPLDENLRVSLNTYGPNGYRGTINPISSAIPETSIPAQEIFICFL
jgi:hypothetical protein